MFEKKSVEWEETMEKLHAARDGAGLEFLKGIREGVGDTQTVIWLLRITRSYLFWVQETHALQIQFEKDGDSRDAYDNNIDNVIKHEKLIKNIVDSIDKWKLEGAKCLPWESES